MRAPRRTIDSSCVIALEHLGLLSQLGLLFSQEDRGEVEAVVQASEFGASVIVDDTWGRELAGQYDLEYHGTVWVLQRFHQLGLMSSATLRASFATLRERGARLPWADVDKLLERLGEEPLGRALYLISDSICWSSGMSLAAGASGSVLRYA
jgi:predicted nucleic acid-binding protein